VVRTSVTEPVEPLLPLLTSVQGSSLANPREPVFCDLVVSRAERLLTPAKHGLSYLIPSAVARQV